MCGARYADSPAVSWLLSAQLLLIHVLLMRVGRGRAYITSIELTVL